MGVRGEHKATDAENGLVFTGRKQTLGARSCLKGLGQRQKESQGKKVNLKTGYFEEKAGI